MSTDPQLFTEADVQPVARAINSASGYHYADDAETWAPYVLRALAEAGRLVPDGAGRVWGVSMGPGRLPAFCEDEHEARRLAYLPTRKVFSRAAGPWVEADGTP